MTHRTKLEGYRQQIRKDQLASYFHQKRILLLQQFTESPQLLSRNTPDMHMLSQLVQRTKQQQQIQKLNSQKWIDRLWPFMEKQYHHTNQQMYASFCMSNLCIIAQPQPPTPYQTELLFDILKTQDLKTITNVLTIFFNYIYDHPLWRDYLVHQRNFITKLRKLFEIQSVNEHFLVTLLKTIIKTLNKSKPNITFLQLADPLLTIIQSSVTLNQELTYTCLSVINQLAYMLQEEVSQKIVESRMLAKLSPLVKFFTSKQLKKMFIQIAVMVAGSLKSKDFKTYLLPLIHELITKDGGQLKIKSCKLLYQCMQNGVFSPFQLWIDPICSKMLLQFEQTDNLQLLTEYSYIFSLCLLNVKLENSDKDTLKYCLQKAKTLVDDIQLQGIIEETFVMLSSK